MKKFLLTVLSLTCISFTVFSTDIADIPWGTSSSEVINTLGMSEAAAIELGRLRLGYDIRIDDQDYTAFLYFDDNRLTEKRLFAKPGGKKEDPREIEDLPPLISRKNSRYGNIPYDHPIKSSLSHYVWQMKNSSTFR